MNNLKKVIFLKIFFLPSLLFAQAIDPELLGDLSADDIAAIKSLTSDDLYIDDSDLEVKEETLTEVDEKIIDANIIPGQKFGYGFFSSIPTSVSAVGDLPLPNDYKISIRDQFVVILSGAKEARFELNVNLDGTIQIPEIGSIVVVGETFEDVKTKISNLIDQSFVGVNIDLSIKNLSAKKISIVGAVKTPGSYLVNPFSTITSALAYSGGISEIGTLRKIKLIRNNGDIFYYDLYEFLIFGDRSKDITIEAGDTILIDAANQFVNLSGAVNRPGIYEVLESEKLSDVIGFGLGFTNLANKKSISVSKLNIESSSVAQLETENLDLDLKNILSVNVFGFKNRDESNIFVSGALTEPGFFNLNTNETLGKLIKNINFVNVYPWLAVLEQFDDKNILTSNHLFNINDPETFENIKLMPNSKIYFISFDEASEWASELPVNPEAKLIDDLKDASQQMINEYALQINHRLGKFSLPVIGNFSVKSLVEFKGIDMQDINDEAIYVSPLEDISISKNYTDMFFKAKKFNAVNFRSLERKTISVNISGAVLYPGNYTIRSDSTLEELYKISGGFLEKAFEDGIVFTRESIRETQLNAIRKAKNEINQSLIFSQPDGENFIDIISALDVEINEENLGRLAGDFSLSNKNTDFILQDGDNLFVPVLNNSISVVGEVFNPSSFILDKNLNAEDAILLAGGYRDYADKQSVYIIRANGLVERKSRNIFVVNQKLYPGDTVIVPPKSVIAKPGLERLIPLTQILSDLAFSAAAIDNLSNN